MSKKFIHLILYKIEAQMNDRSPVPSFPDNFNIRQLLR